MYWSNNCLPIPQSFGNSLRIWVTKENANNIHIIWSLWVFVTITNKVTIYNIWCNDTVKVLRFIAQSTKRFNITSCDATGVVKGDMGSVFTLLILKIVLTMSAAFCNIEVQFLWKFTFQFLKYVSDNHNLSYFTKLVLDKAEEQKSFNIPYQIFSV